MGFRNGNPLQYSCLENPMDGGAWWATVHGVAKSRTRLSDFTSHHITSRGRFIAIQAYLKKQERNQINNLTTLKVTRKRRNEEPQR